MILKRRPLQSLINWKNKTGRKPLIVRGARQVGKTSLLKVFGQEQFEHLLYINLDNKKEFELFSNQRDLDSFLAAIELYFGVNPSEGENLIFVDEIQNSPEIIELVRFFYEERPELYFVGAGSLLEAKIKSEKVSMPVGRVEYLYLYPLDFFEYLDAIGQSQIKEALEEIKIDLAMPKDDFDEIIPDHLHQLANSHFDNYMLVGGMPEIVSRYAGDSSLADLRPVYNGLFQTYLEDINKYTSKEKSKYVTHVLDTAPLAAGSVYSYQNFGASGYKSREMSEAFELLESVMLLVQVGQTDSTSMPLAPRLQRNNKLLFLDNGLVNFRSGNTLATFQQQLLSDEFRGRIAEQVVGQNIIAQFADSKPYLYFWAKEKSISEASIDFCLSSKTGQIVGIEVKSGATGKLKSLYSFMDDVVNSIPIRIYRGKPCFELVTVAGKEYKFHSIPAYLLPNFITSQI